MIHEGRVPYLLHQALDYLLAALLIASPFLLGFSDVGAPTAVAIGVGVLALISAASTDGPLSLVDAIPIPVHVLEDVALGILLIASPFLFGFTDEGTATAFFIVVGVVELLLVVATRYPRETRERVRRRQEPELESAPAASPAAEPGPEPAPPEVLPPAGPPAPGDPPPPRSP